MTLGRGSEWRSGGLLAMALGCFALLPWYSSLPVPHRLLSSAVFAALALGIALWARPRPRPAPSLRDAQQVCSRGGAGLHLTHVQGLGAPGRRYALVLRSADQEIVLAQSFDPGEVLREAHRWAKQLDLSLHPGWGLQAPDLGADADRGRATGHRWRSLVAPAQSGTRTAATALFVCALVYLLFVAGVALLRRGQLSLVSVGLWSLGLTLLTLLGAATRTSRVLLHVGDRVRLERSVLGVVVQRVVMERSELGRLKAVAPAGESARHLLLLADEDSWAIECDVSAARHL